MAMKSQDRVLGDITASFSPLKNSISSSKLNTNRVKPRYNSENAAPINHNIQTNKTPLSGSASFSKKSNSRTKTSPLKEQLFKSPVQENVPAGQDPPVKVVVRIRPATAPGSGDWKVRKVGKNSVSVGDRMYMFDSVFDSNSNQDDVYQLVGAPLVKDALAGYNTSILAYGQTGTGKTHTMWGPPSAMVESPSPRGLQGVAPRVFQSLFSEIQKEQQNSDGKQINYQCRCSFLEVYNEKIGDLLDPAQQNLEIKDDPKNGFYIENMTEEYVSSYDDVNQILIKGLSNRKVGATNVNAKSSRSHIIFTCIIESWSKDSSSKCFGSSKTSRISVVDMAGFDKNMLDDTDKQHTKEGKFIKKSISRLGHLVNILSLSSDSGRSAAVPYKSSRLTHLLKESLGGNAKLSVICAISPHNKCVGETISTLRFGQRVKLMKNDPVINEISEDDVNDLTDQIRQLKEELIRSKSSSCSSLSSRHGYFSGRSVRESVNQLRLNLNRSLILPHIEDCSEKEASIDEADVNELWLQIDKLHGSIDENSEDGECTLLYSAEGCETNFSCEHYLSCSEESEDEEFDSRETPKESPQPNDIASDLDKIPANPMDPPSLTSLSISNSSESTALQDPVLSESPKIGNSQRKSIFSSIHQSNQQDGLGASRNLSNESLHIKSSLCSSRGFPGPTESLAASLHRGLEIIENHQRDSALIRSSLSFSFDHMARKSYALTLAEEREPSYAPYASFVCTKCQDKGIAASDKVEDSSNTWLVPVDESASSNGLGSQVTKDVEKDLGLAIKRQEELDRICKEQASKIEHLSQLLEQYKCQINQDGDMKNQPSPVDEDEDMKCHPQNGENKLVTWSTPKNHKQHIMKEKCGTDEPQELTCGMTKSFDVEEREALLKEIENLRKKLQSYADAPIKGSVDRLRTSLLSQLLQLRKSHAAGQGNCEELEMEREKWMEMESDWILLTDELRIDLEASRQHAEKVEMELRLEKKSVQELDDALKRSVLGHARMVEHYAELQEKYNDLSEKHRAIMEVVEELKKAAVKAGANGCGPRFAKSLASELSALKMEKKRERELLKKENRRLKIQLKETAEAVNAAGELLVRLKEAEETASVAEDKNAVIQEENEKLKKQIEELKGKHKMEINTIKQYLAVSRLPESALQPLYGADSDAVHHESALPESTLPDDDQTWRAEFGPIYQEDLK